MPAFSGPFLSRAPIDKNELKRRRSMGPLNEEEPRSFVTKERCIDPPPPEGVYRPPVDVECGPRRRTATRPTVRTGSVRKRRTGMDNEGVKTRLRTASSRSLTTYSSFVCSFSGSARTRERGRRKEGGDGVGPESDRRTERQTSTEVTLKKRSSLRIAPVDA